MFKKSYATFKIGGVIHRVFGVTIVNAVLKRNKRPPYYRGRTGIMFYAKSYFLYIPSERFNYFMECKRK